MKFSKLIMLMSLVLVVASCNAPKLGYFQDVQSGQVHDLQQPKLVTVQPGDKLSILVGSKDPGLAYLFNLQIVGRYKTSQSDANLSTSQVASYTVDENGEIEPNTTYGLAKRAVENMLELCCRKRYTSIRMASLGSNAGFLNFFVESIMDGKDICVTAPHQYASIMDVSDAVSGILSVENLPLTKRDSVYNLGPGNQYSILDYAETANRIGKNNEFLPVKINVNDKGGDFAICMDCEKIKKQTCWKPLLTKEMMIQKMYEQKTKKQ